MEDREQASAVAAAAQPKRAADLLIADGREHGRRARGLCVRCARGVVRICMPDNVNRWP